MLVFLQDCHGHGTHVAGTAAGATYGVAKGATVHSVKVLNCNGAGTWSGFINGELSSCLFSFNPPTVESDR